MKKILLLCLAIAMMSSCKKTSRSLTNVIPANVTYVVHIDGKSLCEKADLSSNSLVQICSSLPMIYGAEKNLLETILKDPSESGLNIKSDSYIYSQNDTTGFIIGVTDQSKVKKFITTFASKSSDQIQKKEGVSFLTTNNITIGWDDYKLLIMKCHGVSDLSQNVIDQLNQNENKSISNDLSFKKMMDTKGDITACQVNFPSNPIISLLGLGGLKGLTPIYSISFEKGDILINSTTVYRDKDSEAKYKSLMANVENPIKGDQLDYITSNPLFIFAFNINGDALYTSIQKIFGAGFSSQLNMLNNEYSFNKVLGDINGDITFDFNFDANKKPLITIMAGLKDSKDISVLLDKLTPLIGLKKLSPTSYIASIPEPTIGHLNISLNNNLFSISNSVLTKQTNTQFASAKGQKVLLHMSFDKLPLLNQDKPILAQFASIFESIDVLPSQDPDNQTLKIGMKDKNKNSFAVLCSLLTLLNLN